MSGSCIWLKGREALDTFATTWAAWNALLPPARRFPLPSMWAAWVDCYASRPPWRGEPQLLLATDGIRPLAMLPLHSWGSRIAGLLSHAGHWSPWRAAISPDGRVAESADTLARGLMRLPCQAFLLGPTPGNDRMAAALLDALDAQGFRRIVQHHAPLASSKLPPTWDEFTLHQVHKSVLSNANYYTRRMERDPANTLRHWLNPTGEQAEALFSQMGDVERRSWLVDEEDGQCRFVHAHQRLYWRRVSEACQDAGFSLEVWIIHEGEKPIAFSICLGSPGCRHLVANNYDAAYAKWTTGAVLYLRMFRQFIEEGVREVDFGSGGLHYKSKWGAEYTDWKTSYLVFKPGLWGGLKAAAMRQMLAVKERRAEKARDGISQATPPE